MKPGCIIEGCDRESKTRGMCGRHYARYLKGSDLAAKNWRDFSIEERVAQHLDPPDPVTGCIEWNGRKTPKMGYGRIVINGVAQVVHRVMWEVRHGPIPEGMLVLHHCDNPPCCNDEHLFLGTYQDNTDDMIAKGRSPDVKGSKNGFHKLSDEEVIEVKRLISCGQKIQVIADRFKVTKSAISDIKRKKRWSHINGPSAS